MPISRNDALALAEQLTSLPSGFGQDEGAWVTAVCNVLVSSDDLPMASRAIELTLDTETHRPAPATLRLILDGLRSARTPAREPDGTWKGCSCLRGWVHTRQWVNGMPYDFAGRCRVCQVAGTADPARLWEGYQ